MLCTGDIGMSAKNLQGLSNLNQMDTVRHVLFRGKLIDDSVRNTLAGKWWSELFQGWHVVARGYDFN